MTLRRYNATTEAGSMALRVCFTLSSLTVAAAACSDDAPTPTTAIGDPALTGSYEPRRTGT